jgi:hypothetical protein
LISASITRFLTDKFVFYGISKSGNNVLTLILEDIADKKCEHEIKEDIFSSVSLDSFLKLHSTKITIKYRLPTPTSILR